MADADEDDKDDADDNHDDADADDGADDVDSSVSQETRMHIRIPILLSAETSILLSTTKAIIQLLDWLEAKAHHGNGMPVQMPCSYLSWNRRLIEIGRCTWSKPT